MSFNEPIDKNSQNIIDGRQISNDLTLDFDIVIIGSGSGGAMAAQVLSKRGYKVLVAEEGPLKLTSDFKMREAKAYPELYQESAGRLTKDKGIKILQGRNVGGGTTVNWTSSFKTPKRSLDWWKDRWKVEGCSESQMLPYFEEVEKRMGIRPWDIPPNENNETLAKGLTKLKLSHGVISRNVIDCQNLGYCGMGCPVGAKQSTLVSLLPEAIKNGATLGHHLRCEKLILEKGKVKGVYLRAMDTSCLRPSSRKILVKAKKVILAAGAIGSPAILLRSKVADPFHLVGKRTFVHPVCLSGAMMDSEVEAWQGAPQVIYSDHFLETRPHSGKMGFKLEVAPIHPVILSSVIDMHGDKHRYVMENYPYFQVIIALLRDGFHPESVGGEVYLKQDGSPGLDYKISPYVWNGIRDAWLASAEIQFAAGAKKVWPIHREADFYTSWSEAKASIMKLPLEVLNAKIVSAHVMGGCAMSEEEKLGVVDSLGKHHQLENLYIMDGSIFPTSVATNPMESILGFALKNAQALKI
ncbi:MAG: GMC family oxidoreductase [Halobacteriovorax sp.]|nr:GMC family oxidoreductase [Halobacteriovorax sp.]|tara:strand:+ start:95715 stop:97286 length:1572 start_codon:yes stop_codon:yes gene_type:complete